MENLIDRMARRTKHPVAIVISFVAPLASIPFSLLPTWGAIAVSAIIAVGWIAFLCRGPSSAQQQGTEQHQVVPVPSRDQRAPRAHPSIAASQVRLAIRGHMLQQFGERALLDYYQRHANQPYDSMYREAIESLLDDPTWGPLAHGAQEWVVVGYDVLVGANPSWGNDSTKCKLYRAVIDCMLRERLNLSRGVQFAEHVKGMVAARRFHGG